MHFHYFVIWKRTSSFIWTFEIESPSPKNGLYQAWLILAQWFCRFFTLYFHYFVIIFPWKEGVALHINKLEFLPPKDALCQVWLKLVESQNSEISGTQIAKNRGLILVRLEPLLFYTYTVTRNLVFFLLTSIRRLFKLADVIFRRKNRILIYLLCVP